ncbi:hypothetical protein JBL43_12625 [Aureibaculum sp. A20]|uniref:Toxin-antitoxin system YwqK family antitoxin n=1 Tax=Aureibaculum flavum TaxID=2795986 RepID=A0ABS0WSY1_9FLAO|nr:toxin-antitoxin system YwqK family antitoxin [Aureibaculum flavum]MBJ2175089.1 hypothetical protein [Aureibaculum flavum]
MKTFFTKLSLSKLLIINTFLLYSIFSNAQFNNNYFTYFPQAYFDIKDASSKLEAGMSTIRGVAFTRDRNEAGLKKVKHYGRNTIVMLFPVTDYLIEWQKLVGKTETKPNANVIMDKVAFQYRIEALTDEYGNFTFKNIKPGKYFLQCDIDFVGVASDYARTGTVYYGLIASSPIYEKYFYNYNGRSRTTLMVEIETDGQVKEVKLKPNIFQSYKNIGSQFIATQNCYFKNNLQNGKCNEYNENGTLSAVAEWKDGLQHGETTLYHPNGKMQATGKVKKGFNTGVWKYFDKNEKLESERNFVFKKDIGYLEGAANYYYSSGVIQAEGEFLRNFRNGVWKYYDKAGNITSEETYVYKNKTSYLEGDVVIYYPSGKIKEKDVYVNGKANGEVITYYESGEIKMKALFKDDLKHGPVIYYNEIGEITKQENYSNGELEK